MLTKDFSILELGAWRMGLVVNINRLQVQGYNINNYLRK